MELAAGPKPYPQEFRDDVVNVARNRELDGGATRPDDEWQSLQRHVGEVIWRLEDAGAESGTLVIHSDEAVEPRGDVQWAGGAD